MAVKRWVPINQINGVAAAATAVANMVVGPRRYHITVWGYKTATVGGATEATMASEISEIRYNLDSVTQRKYKTQELFDLNRQKGKTPTVSASTSIPGYITVFLSEPQRRTTLQREATCWGMADISSFQVEFDISSGASSPVLSGFALIDDVNEVNGLIVKLKREIIQVSATGDVTYKLDTSRGDSYQSLTFKETTAGDIDNVKLNWDGIVLYQDDENFAVELLNISDFTKVTKYRHMPVSWNDLQNVIPTRKPDQQGNLTVPVGEFTATLTMAAAANVVCLREVLGRKD